MNNSRRNVLATSCTALATLLSGCFALGQRNTDSEPSVSIEIEEQPDDRAERTAVEFDQKNSRVRATGVIRSNNVIEDLSATVYSSAETDNVIYEIAVDGGNPANGSQYVTYRSVASFQSPLPTVVKMAHVSSGDVRALGTYENDPSET